MARPRGGGHPRVCATRRSHADRRCTPPVRGTLAISLVLTLAGVVSAIPATALAAVPAPRPAVRRSRPARPSSPTTSRSHGRGYGHGVGLSQYGARGRALDGQDAATILAHYYTGHDARADPSPAGSACSVLSSFAATAAKPLVLYGRRDTLDHRRDRRDVPGRREAPPDPDHDHHLGLGPDVLADPSSSSKAGAVLPNVPARSEVVRPRRRRPRPAPPLVQARHVRHVPRRPAPPPRDHQVRGQRGQRRDARDSTSAAWSPRRCRSRGRRPPSRRRRSPPARTRLGASGRASRTTTSSTTRGPRSIAASLGEKSAIERRGRRPRPVSCSRAARRSRTRSTTRRTAARPRTTRTSSRRRPVPWSPGR